MLLANNILYSVAASLLNRSATAKQRGRHGFKDPVVDAGWGLFLAHDMARNDRVLDYRFVDGREGVDQLKRSSFSVGAPLLRRSMHNPFLLAARIRAERQAHAVRFQLP